MKIDIRRSIRVWRIKKKKRGKKEKRKREERNVWMKKKYRDKGKIK